MDILELIEQREGIVEKKKNIDKRISNKIIEVEDVYPRCSSKNMILKNSNNKSNSSKVYVKRR